MIWPSFRAVSSAVCLSASACFNLHTQTKAGDTNMQNKKKQQSKQIMTKTYACIYVYIFISKMEWDMLKN